MKFSGFTQCTPGFHKRYVLTSVYVSFNEIFFSCDILDVSGKLGKPVPRFRPEVKNVTLHRFRVHSIRSKSFIQIGRVGLEELLLYT